MDIRLYERLELAVTVDFFDDPPIPVRHVDERYRIDYTAQANSLRLVLHGNGDQFSVVAELWALPLPRPLPPPPGTARLTPYGEPVTPTLDTAGGQRLPAAARRYLVHAITAMRLSTLFPPNLRILTNELVEPEQP
jgi:hypothetical protein